MLGSVRAGFRLSRLRDVREPLPSFAAKLDPGRVLEAAARALELQRCAALAAKLYAARVYEAAGWATHGRSRGTGSTLDLRTRRIQQGRASLVDRRGNRG